MLCYHVTANRPLILWTERTRRRLKLRDLETLMTVVETGSRGKAAGRFGISQPGVSKAIVDLEDALWCDCLIAERRALQRSASGGTAHRGLSDPADRDHYPKGSNAARLAQHFIETLRAYAWPCPLLDSLSQSHGAAAQEYP